MKALAVIPIITPDWADQCIASIRRPDSSLGFEHDDILVVDNSRSRFARSYGLRTYEDPDGHNLGVARSWNVGAEEVLNSDYDYLVLMSASMMFGPILHCTFKWQLEQFAGAKIIEADGHSWHLIAIHRTCFEKIGLFDENFYPGYFEQIDWCYRLRMVGWEQGFIRVWVNALSQAVAGHNEIVSCPATPLLAYYEEKWGGPKGQEQWVQPFGNKPLEYWPVNDIPTLATKYGLENWW